MAEQPASNPKPDTPQDEHSPIWGGREPLDVLLMLRAGLVRSAVVFGAAFVIAWIFREELTDWVRWPLIKAFPPGSEAQTILLRVIDAFMLHVKLCFFVALAVVVPYWLFKIWRVVKRAQSPDGVRFGRGLLLGMVGLFYSGVAFAYYIALPAAFSFLVGYSLSGEGVFVSDQMLGAGDALAVSMREHVTFTMKLLLAFGIGFEAPMVMLVLARAGLVDAERFAKKRGLALVVLAIASAALTPPDPWTMAILLVPLYILYEVGILLARAVEAPARKAKREEGARDEHGASDTDGPDED